MGQLLAGSINEVVPSFRNKLREYVKASVGQAGWAFTITQKIVYT